MIGSAGNRARIRIARSTPFRPSGITTSVSSRSMPFVPAVQPLERLARAIGRFDLEAHRAQHLRRDIGDLRIVLDQQDAPLTVVRAAPCRRRRAPSATACASAAGGS